MLNHKGLFFLLLGIFYGSVSSELVQGNCGEGHKRCEIGACLEEKYVCDGIIHCADESDEKNCTFISFASSITTAKSQRACPSGYVACATGDICVEEDGICNGVPSCPDGSDEKNCLASTTVESQRTGLNQGFCQEGYLACETGAICVNNQNICDGRFHCLDGSDERYCDLGNDKIDNQPVILETKSMSDLATTTQPSATTVLSPEEDTNTESDEKDKDFRLEDDIDHCAHYKRMIILVRRVHIKLAKMEQKTARHIKHLINEILMEAGMENFASLLELHHVCNAKITEDKRLRQVPSSIN